MLIISPDDSDAAQIRTPKVASFLRDVTLRDLAVHSTHAFCVNGRGEVYQWRDGSSLRGLRLGIEKSVLTLRGQVSLIPISLVRRQVVFACRRQFPLR